MIMRINDKSNKGPQVDKTTSFETYKASYKA
jgi:hypothetical protein